jgi:hypothetical protein
VASGKVARRAAVCDIAALLDSDEVAALIGELDALRWTGRKGYGARALVGACLGQRYLYNHGPERQAYSDPDASWGHRSAVSTRKGGGFYGYKLHLARLHPNGPAARVADWDGPPQRVPVRRVAPGRAPCSRVPT